MLMQSCRTDKKGALADFFSIITFIVLMIVFYLFFRLTIGKAQFQVHAESKNIQDSISLLGILRTPINDGNSRISVAELIAMSKTDDSKGKLLEKSLVQNMDDSFGTALCSVACIDGREIKGSGCISIQRYTCNENPATIPGYNGNTIEVSLTTGLEATDIQNAP